MARAASCGTSCHVTQPRPFTHSRSRSTVKRMTQLRLARLALLLVATASCSSAKHYEMRGQILAINRDRMEILVKHEEIEGLMPAMTMPWKVRAVNMLDNLGPG